MKISQVYRFALIAIVGVFVAAVFYTGPIAQTKSPQGVRNIVIVHGAWADGSSWSRVIPAASSQGFPCGRRAEPIDLAG